MKKSLWHCLLPVFSLLALPARAQGEVEVEVLSNELSVTINLGSYQADLRITFEEVIGLNADSVDIQVVSTNPLAAGFLSRLPDPTQISLPGQLPLVLSINPSSQSSLSFTGVVTIELSTSNLQFHPSFRLFTSSAGESFRDITDFSGVGSYRVRGTTGEFSDFIIVADLRASADVINQKFSRLQSILDAGESEIPGALLESLQDKLNLAVSQNSQGLRAGAIAALEAFEAQVRENQGSIPAVYRANDPDTLNLAGELRSQVKTLIFSLKLS